MSNTPQTTKRGKRKTAQRKAAQAEDRYIKSLRRQVAQYESFGDPARMSKQRLEAIIKRGKRRITFGSSSFLGMQLAVAAMEKLHEGH